MSVTDFILDKDNIFTEINLTQEEIDLFKGEDSLKVNHPSPDLVVYLQGQWRFFYHELECALHQSICL